MARLTVDVEDIVPAILDALSRREVAERLVEILRPDAPAVSAPAFMTVEGYAARLDVSAKTVRMWIKKRKMPCAREGSVVRVHVESADRWLLDGGQVGAAVRATVQNLRVRRAG